LTTDEEEGNWDGTGLGLPICLKLITNMHAFIRYGSIPNVRTVFSLFIPLQGQGLMDYKLITIDIGDQKARELSIISNHKCNDLLIAEDNLGISKI